MNLEAQVRHFDIPAHAPTVSTKLRLLTINRNSTTPAIPTAIERDRVIPFFHDRSPLVLTFTFVCLESNSKRTTHEGRSSG